MRWTFLSYSRKSLRNAIEWTLDLLNRSESLISNWLGVSTEEASVAVLVLKNSTWFSSVIWPWWNPNKHDFNSWNWFFEVWLSREYDGLSSDNRNHEKRGIWLLYYLLLNSTQMYKSQVRLLDQSLFSTILLDETIRYLAWQKRPATFKVTTLWAWML